MNTQIASLVHVCSASLAELKEGVAALEGADPRTIDARLRHLESTATTLSSGLDKLSRLMYELPPEHTDSVAKGPMVPEDDNGFLLRAAQRLCEVVCNV